MNTTVAPCSAPVVGGSNTNAEKCWATACARAAMAGYTLLRTDPRDGDVAYILARFGLLRRLSSLSDLDNLLGVP